MSISDSHPFFRFLLEFWVGMVEDDEKNQTDSQWFKPWYHNQLLLTHHSHLLSLCFCFLGFLFYFFLWVPFFWVILARDDEWLIFATLDGWLHLMTTFHQDLWGRSFFFIFAVWFFFHLFFFQKLSRSLYLKFFCNLIFERQLNPNPNVAPF